MMHSPPPGQPPVFDAAFQQQFTDLLSWRRDVRRFRSDPVPAALIETLVDLMNLSPSVGNSQPWRLVAVDNPTTRAGVVADFQTCNGEAMATYEGDKAGHYARLKLEGLQVAPIHLAVFCDENAEQGHRLGRLTMPEMLQYSTAIAVHTFWLAARVHGLGVGWVSILNPTVVQGLLDVPAHWRLIAYLCVGWPAEEHLDPELERHKWQARGQLGHAILQR